MIVTPDFVYVHMPKTGGTFVSEVVERLYADRKLPRPLRSLRKAAARHVPAVPPYEPPVRRFEKHAFASQVPADAAHLPLVGCVRNPLDRYVSQYTFRWWRSHPDFFPGLAAHPDFPDLSFAQFLDLAHRHWTTMYSAEVAPGLGWHTVQLIHWYCRDAESLVATPGLTADDIREAMYPVTLLDTGTLNRDLHEFLRAIGFAEERVAFVLELRRIHPEGVGRPPEDRWQAHYTPELRRRVLLRERLLFELFPSWAPLGAD